MINRAIRELDREKTGLEREEKRLTMEIKKAAKEGQMGAVKIMAKVSEFHSTVAKADRTGAIGIKTNAPGMPFWRLHNCFLAKAPRDVRNTTRKSFSVLINHDTNFFRL